MYDNIGGKIKGLAKAYAIIGVIAAIITGISLFFTDDLVPLGFILIIFGPFVAWVSSWLLYGFGELIDKTSAIEGKIHRDLKKSEVQMKVESSRISKIEKLRSEGLITEEEYLQAISKNEQRSI